MEENDSKKQSTQTMENNKKRDVFPIFVHNKHLNGREVSLINGTHGFDASINDHQNVSGELDENGLKEIEENNNSDGQPKDQASNNEHYLKLRFFNLILLIGFCQTMHTTSILFFQTYIQSKIYDSNQTYKDAIFTYSLLIGKIFGGSMASFNIFNDRRR